MSTVLALIRRHALDAALALAVLGAAAPWLGRWSAAADLLTQLLIQIAIATALLLVGLVLTRRWWRAPVAAACLALQLVVLDPRPEGGAVAAVPQARVLALNVWVDNPDPEATLAAVRRSGADVVVLTEIFDDWRARIGTLADIYPERVDCLDRPGCDVAILARHPIHAGRGTSDPVSGAPYVEARMIVDGRPLTVAGTHLVRPFGNGTLALQEAQLRYVGARLREARGPRLLVGDLNGVGWGRLVAGFAASSGLRLLPALDGTWPAYLPAPLRIPIDQVLVGPELDAVTRVNGAPVGSDHLPVIVELGSTAGG